MEIDSLDIQISAEAKKSTDAIDSIIDKLGKLEGALKIDTSSLGNIGKNIDVSGLSKNMQSIKSEIKDISNISKEIAKPMEKVKKSAAEVAKELSVKFKDFTPKIDFTQSEQSLTKIADKYRQQMVNAQNDINRILASSTADKQIAGIERWTIKLKEAENAVKEIEQHFAKISIKKAENATAQISDKDASELIKGNQYLQHLQEQGATGLLDDYIRALREKTSEIQVESNDTKRTIEDFNSWLSNFKMANLELNYGFNTEDMQSSVQGMIDSLKTSMSELQSSFPNAQNTITAYAHELENLEKIYDEVRLTTAQSISKIEAPKIEISDLDELKAKLQSIVAAAQELNKVGEQVSLRESLESTFSQIALGAIHTGEKLRNVGSNIREFKAELQNLRASGEQISLGASLIDAVTPINSIDKITEKLKELKESAKETGNKIKESLQNNNFSRIGDGVEISNSKIVDLNAKLQELQSHLKKLKAEGIGLGFADYEETLIEITKINEQLKEYENNLINSSKLGYKFSDSWTAFKKLFSDITTLLQKVNKVINSVLSKVGKLAKSMLHLGGSAKSSGNGFNFSLMTLLKYGLGIRSLYVLFNRLRSAVKEGMENLIQYSDRTNQSVSMLKSSLNQLKNSAAAAFAPVLNAIAPALNTLIQLFIKATNAINQFFAALTGQSTWIRAKYVYDDVAESIGGAAKAAKGALQPFDKLNNLTSQTSGGAGATLPEDMFETLPIEDKFKNLSDKIKDIMSKIFAPLKEAWNREGKFVMDSWKYALDEVWNMVKDIGRDFLEVWQQEKTIKIFEDILHIIGDIGLTIGHLARNFREAWNENQVGLHILENIRDIIGVIIHNIRLAADATVEWADNLNFTPILEAFKRFTASLIPVADALSGVLTDFYTQVLLPLGKWTLEKGLPELLDVFTAFNEKVDWTALRDNLSEFWSHLEPFAETVGEGLILFIERVSDALANFLNSQEFKDFLTKVEQWMDKVTPEDVANGLEKIAKGIIKLKVGLAAWNILKEPLGILADFFKLISTFKLAKAIKNMGGASAGGGLLASISGAVSSLGGLGSILTADLAELIPTLAGAGTAAEIGVVIGTGILGGLAGAIGGGVLGKALDNYILAPLMSFDEELSEQYKNFKWFGEDGFFARFKDSFTDDSWKDALKMWGQDIIDGIGAIFTDIGNAVFNFSTTFDLLEGAAECFKNAKTAFENQDWIGLAEDIVMGIVGGLSGAISFLTEPIADIFNAIYKGICSLFGIHSPSTVMAEVGKNIMLGLLNGFKAIWTSITTWITEKIQWLSNKIKSISNMFSGISGAAKSALGGSSFGNIGNLVGSAISKRTATYSVGASTASTYSIDIPTYATGGFPEDGWFRASKGEYFGKFDDGTSYIANNNQIESGMASGIEQAAYRGMMRALRESGGMGGSSNVSVTLEGEMANLFRAFQREYKSDAKRKGITSLDPVLG